MNSGKIGADGWTGRVDGTGKSKVLQEVLADLKMPACLPIEVHAGLNSMVNYTTLHTIQISHIQYCIKNTNSTVEDSTKKYYMLKVVSKKTNYVK